MLKHNLGQALRGFHEESWPCCLRWPSASDSSPPSSASPTGCSRWLGVPPRSLPGDEDNVAGAGPRPRRFGEAGGFARLEEEASSTCLSARAGPPISPYYRKGHEAWEEGRPTPFLPSPEVHRLRLVPAG